MRAVFEETERKEILHTEDDSIYRYSSLVDRFGKTIVSSNSPELVQKVFDTIRARSKEGFYREMIVQMLPGASLLFRVKFLKQHPDLIFPYLFRIRKVKLAEC